VGSLVISALKGTCDLSIYSALDLISALMQPMHSEADLRIEQENKEKILNSTKFLDSLLEMWTSHVKRGTGALVTMAMLDILTFGLCAPYSETTMGSQFDSLIQAVANRANVLFALFQVVGGVYLSAI
jgi:DnaJ family protein C protein 13